MTIYKIKLYHANGIANNIQRNVRDVRTQHAEDDPLKGVAEANKKEEGEREIKYEHRFEYRFE